MASGIRVTVTFETPYGCPIGRFSERADGSVDQPSTSVSDGESGAVVTEFLADADVDTADLPCEAVFSYGSRTLYRTPHGEFDCPCTCLGTYGCPMHRYAADDGELTLVFHAETFERLQTVMAEFRERYPSVDVRQMLRPPLEGTREERVFVNRAALTDRQREVLETAYERGYFERPKGANATEIAGTLGISQSTFTEHLVTAQRKLLDDIFDGA
ncbi:helix-turn-helix domain-containing protein [Halovivax limisalsi]|uniref:helix-turn-helix domain-containing protein n=1 Tax=Halovivax limisalsi TaxID=1453760 RepID=UPI001FFCE9CC|nr:helix-turn-helix domain-containing protein [Halovivax limisalsi]